MKFEGGRIIGAGFMSLLFLMLSACQKQVVPGQTIVTGRNLEITVSEFDQLLRAAPPVQKEQVGPARSALLQALISQKLLAEAGKDADLDKRPEVEQQIAESRRVILANAYVHSVEGHPAQSTDEEVLRYYNAHPALFKNRLQFDLQEYVLSIGSSNIGHYADILNKHGFAALSGELAVTAPHLRAVELTLMSSDLPASSRESALGLGVGSDVVYSTADAVHLGHVTAVRPVSVDLPDARNQILNSIVQDKQARLVTRIVEDLRRMRNVQIVNPKLAKGKAS